MKINTFGFFRNLKIVKTDIMLYPLKIQFPIINQSPFSKQPIHDFNHEWKNPLKFETIVLIIRIIPDNSS